MCELTGGCAAIAAPAVMWTEFLTFGLATPGYSVLTRAASDLGARNAPDAWLFVAGFFYLAGALTVLLGVSLALMPAATWAWRLGAGLVALEGVLLVLSGAFPRDPASPGGTALHQELAAGCFVVAAASPLVLAIGAARATVPSRLRRTWLVSAGALLLLVVADQARAAARLPDGVFQRPFGVVLTVTFVTTGLWLLRGTAGRESRPAHDQRPLPRGEGSIRSNQESAS